MNKISFILFVFGLVSACTSRDITITTSTQEPNEESQFEHALEELDLFYYSFISPETKSGRPTISNIHEIKSQRTKASEDHPLAYLVNFDNDSGFAVLGASEADHPIYAYSSNGNLSSLRLESAINGDDFDVPSEEDELYYLLANAITSNSEVIFEDENMRITYFYGNWENEIDNESIIKTKWGQSYPFNMCMPQLDSMPIKNRGKAYTGCVPTAYCQLLYALRPTIYIAGNNNLYMWSDIEDVCTYENFRDFSSTNYDSLGENQKSKMEKVSDIISKFASRINATYKKDGTYSKASQADSVLRIMNPTIFANLHLEALSSDCVSQFWRGTPTPIVGRRRVQNDTTRGHCWLVDGYATRMREITILTVDLRDGEHVYSTRLQSEELIHFNWGWNGRYDGYYSASLFSPGMQSLTDPEYDTNSGNGYLSDRNYIYETYIAVY